MRSYDDITNWQVALWGTRICQDHGPLAWLNLRVDVVTFTASFVIDLTKLQAFLTIYRLKMRFEMHIYKSTS